MNSNKLDLTYLLFKAFILTLSVSLSLSQWIFFKTFRRICSFSFFQVCFVFISQQLPGHKVLPDSEARNAKKRQLWFKCISGKIWNLHLLPVLGGHEIFEIELVRPLKSGSDFLGIIAFAIRGRHVVELGNAGVLVRWIALGSFTDAHPGDRLKLADQEKFTIDVLQIFSLLQGCHHTSCSFIVVNQINLTIRRRIRFFESVSQPKRMSSSVSTRK